MGKNFSLFLIPTNAIHQTFAITIGFIIMPLKTLVTEKVGEKCKDVPPPKLGGLLSRQTQIERGIITTNKNWLE